ncbi:MAG: sugar transferase [Chloroflexota bacterium]|nr:MAG: sugar transferase [Chloroflexota bacterium]
MYAFTKRLFDILASLLGLTVAAPLFVLIGMLIRRDSPGPILYRGIRAGKDGRPFAMLKFRTMVMNADQIGGPSTAADDPRLTRTGRWLRKYKLDELPQLINVLRGEMSLVGPRPEVLSEVEGYSANERTLLTVRPGITDWASMRFNDEGEILQGCSDPHQAYLERIRPEKMRLGLEYVHTRSLLLDMQIVVQTVAAIFTTRARSR